MTSSFASPENDLGPRQRVSPAPPVEVSLSNIHHELSSKRRWVHRLILIANAIAIAGVLSLWVTEPGPLPTRLHVAFATLLVIQSVWIITSAWILTRRHCPDSLSRITTAWASVIACSLFTAVGVAICLQRGEPAIALGIGLMGTLAIVITTTGLRGAYSRHSSLNETLLDLKRSNDATNKLLLLSCFVWGAAPLNVVCLAETQIDTKSQTVIDRHVQACGGRQAMESIQSQRIRGLLVRHGKGIPIEILQQAPHRSLTTTRFPRPGTLLQGYDGKTAWIKHPTQGNLHLDRARRDSIADESWMHRTLSIQHVFQKITHDLDRSRPNGSTVLRMEKRDGSLTWWSFDHTTHRLQSIEQNVDLGPRGEAKINIHLEDYRPLDGVYQPWVIRTVTPTTQTKLQVQSIEHNLEVADNAFSAPR
ncbi:MAG: hypothetical protein AAF989_01505 [Planctomycetota bacterium]